MKAQELKAIYERKVRAMRARPDFAYSTATAHAKLIPERGMRAEVRCGDHEVLADQPTYSGGSDCGPSPSHLMRASVSSGLAMGYAIWAARLEVPLEAIEVELACDQDMRGQVGLEDGISPGWLRIEYTVRLTSPAAEDELQRVVETADRYSAMLANLDPRIVRSRRIEIVRPGDRPHRSPQWAP